MHITDKLHPFGGRNTHSNWIKRALRLTGEAALVIRSECAFVVFQLVDGRCEKRKAIPALETLTNEIPGTWRSSSDDGSRTKIERINVNGGSSYHKRENIAIAGGGT